MQEENKSSVASVIGIIIIIALIVLGGLYFWGKRIEESRAAQNLSTDTTQPTATTSNEATAIRSQSSSDDLSSIEADLNATKVDGLDSELQAQ